MRKTHHRLPVSSYQSLSPTRWSALPTAKIVLLALAWLLVVPFVFGQANAQEFFTPARNPASEGLTLDLEGYWQLAKNTRDQATWAKNHPAHEIRPTFLQAATLWESLVAVRLPDRTIIPIDTSAIVIELRTDPPDPERLETLLNTLLEQRQTWPAGSFGMADLQKLNEILAKPEYQWSEEAPPSPLEEWAAQQFERFANWLSGVLEGTISTNSLRVWQLVLIGLGALTLVLVLGYVGRNLRRAVTAEAELAIDDRIEKNLSAGAALSKAQAMSNSGDYRTAVRYLYLAALLQLEERGLLRYDRSRTNREYLGDIQRRSGAAQLPGLLDNFAEVVEVFDRVWYGYQPLDQTAYEQYSNQVAKLRERR